MLRKWHQPQSDIQEVKEEVKESEEIPVWQEEEKSAPPIGGLLSSEQREDLRELLVQFKKVFDEKPGQTTIAEHKIQTEEHTAIRVPPYRLPQA